MTSVPLAIPAVRLSDGERELSCSTSKLIGAIVRRMSVDSRFASKLDSVDDAPGALRNALTDNFQSQDSIRLLIHAPAFSTMNEAWPATILGVTNDRWVVVSETENGLSVEKCNFRETLFFELTSILLSGQLKIYFAAVGTSCSITMRFDTLGEELYREAIDLMLQEIDPKHVPAGENDRGNDLISKDWPMPFRAEARRYRPKGQRLLAATQWRAVIGGFQRELSPAGALLVTERDLVLISEEKTSPRAHIGDVHNFGGIITYIPVVRLADFRVSHHEQFGVLALQVHATHGGETLEIILPSDHEKAVSEAIEKVVKV